MISFPEQNLARFAAAAALAGAGYLALLAGRARRPQILARASAVASQAAILAAVAVIARSALDLADSSRAFLPFVALLALVYLHQDLAKAALARRSALADGEPHVPAWFAASSWIICLGAALAAFILVDRSVYDEFAVPLWLIMMGCALLAAALARVSAPFHASGLLLVALAFAGFVRGLWRWDHLLDHSLWTILASSLLAALAFAQDFMLMAAGEEMRPAPRRLASASALALYACAFFTAARLLEYEFEFPWFIAALAPFGLILHGAASALRMRLGMIAAWAVFAAGLLALIAGWPGRIGGLPALAAPVALFAAQTIIYERWLAAGRGFEIRWKGADLSLFARVALAALSLAALASLAWARFR